METRREKPSLMTLDDVAGELSVSRRTVERYITLHGLPCIKFSDKVQRVRREDFDSWLAAAVSVS